MPGPTSSPGPLVRPAPDYQLETGPLLSIVSAVFSGQVAGMLRCAGLVLVYASRHDTLAAVVKTVVLVVDTVCGEAPAAETVCGEGGRLFRPPSFRPEPSPVQVQFVMVRVVDSQWLEPVTLGSLLAKVTSHETLVLVSTV
jgi:hypothetical protein